MESKIAKALLMKENPVAVYRSDTLPEGAVQFKEGVWGCVVALMNMAAAKGKTAACSLKTTVCVGGKAGLGLAPYPHGYLEKFLSDGEGIEREGERYKKTPELALEFMDNIPAVGKKEYVVFVPLSQVEDIEPELVVFLVNPDRLSALATLANFDSHTQDNVRLLFGAGCTQSVLYGLDSHEQKSDICYIGMTDLSARLRINREHLSFTIPYRRFLEIEANVEHSFLTTHTWETIAKRLDK